MKRTSVLLLASAVLLTAASVVHAEPVWFEETGHYYEAVAEPDGIEWEEARAACEARCGYLATILTGTENEFVFDLIDDPGFWFIDAYNNAIGPWIGGFQPDGSPEPNGDWQWLTGEPWGFTNWGPGEPNNFGGSEEDALSYFGWGGIIGSQWNDRGKTIAMAYGYVCEWSANPTSVSESEGRIGSLSIRPYPNPARNGVSIQFSRSLSARGDLRVYNIAGQLIQSLPLRVSSGTVVWDGRDSAGNTVTPGVYFLHLIDADQCETARVTVVR